MAEAATAGDGATAMACVAQVATVHGVRGAVKLRCFTEAPESVAAYGPLCDERGRELFRVEILHRVKGGVVARLEGVDSREAAESLRGLLLHVPRRRLPKPAEDEFYRDDLVGLAAADPAGAELGRVVAVHNFGAGDLIEVRDPDGGSLMVPFTREAVPQVDVRDGFVTVARIDGLLEDAA